MDIHDRAGLKFAAGESLAAAGSSPKKLVLVYAGASAALALLITGLDYYLEHQISDTGGLGGLGLRSILSTAQSVLPIAQALLIPFWDLGFKKGLLQLSRQEETAHGVLLEGFRRFGVSTRFLLLQIIIYMGIGFAGSYLGTQLFMFTPFAQPLFEVMLSGSVEEAALTTALIQVQTPLLLFNLACFLLLCVPVMFRYRLAGFLLMDHPQNGALAALRGSRRIMKGNCLSLLRLDLSLWWFYAVELLLGLIAYADMLLPLVGIELPFSADAAYFISYIVALVLQLGWYYFSLARVQLTYAHAYTVLATPPAQAAQPKSVNQPWNYEV